MSDELISSHNISVHVEKFGLRLHLQVHPDRRFIGGQEHDPVDVRQRELPLRQQPHHGGRVRHQEDRSGRQDHQDPDLGHGKSAETQAGQESFRTITRAYYKNAIGIILVYDLGEPKSLETIDSWLKEISDNSNEKAEVVLVGNKQDLLKAPPAHSPKPQFPFFTTSAKTGTNITKLFTALSQRVLDKIEQGKIDVDTVPLI